MGWDIDVRETVYQRLANEIFFRILHGEYVAGAKLPSYIKIAKEAGSSPETVRKAIRVLQEHSSFLSPFWRLQKLRLFLFWPVCWQRRFHCEISPK